MINDGLLAVNGMKSKRRVDKFRIYNASDPSLKSIQKSRIFFESEDMISIN